MILAIAFIQGAMDFYHLAIFYYYKDDLGVGMSTLSVIQGILIIPWTIKSLFGFLIDSHHFLGTSKKGYLIFSCLVEIIGFLSLSFLPRRYFTVVIIQFINHCCLVVRNVVGESLLVEFSKDWWEAIKEDNSILSSEQD